MGTMKRLYADAQDAFDRYEAEVIAPDKHLLSEEHREMFIIGYVQRAFDEARRNNEERVAHDSDTK